MITRNIIARPANISDIPFIVETITQAEKSGTDKFGLSTLFGLDENQVKKYLFNILEEEIDGCEFSLSSFLLADIDGMPAAAVGGWVEGANEDSLPSSILKANLLSYCMPKESILRMKENADIISGVQIERENGSYQIEYVYVKYEYRKCGLVQLLIDSHIKRAVGCHKMYVQVFENNVRAIHSYEKAGFSIFKKYHSDNSETYKYLPDSTKLLLLKLL